MLIDHKIPSVISVQAVFGTEPHKTAAVLQDGINSILREAVVDGEVAEF